MARPSNPDRSFGLVLGGALLALAAVRWVWTGTVSWWLVGASALFFVAAGLAPSILGPVRTAWMKFAAVLGAINARILLTVVFAALITPFALILRAMGRNPIRLTAEGRQSYWRPRRPEEFTAKRMERQF